MNILPPDYLKDSLASYIYKHTTRSQIIYWVVLLALIICLIALPFIYVDVTVQNQGMIRPVNERTEIKVPVSESVDSVYVKEGDRVRQGDVLLHFRTDNLRSQFAYLQQKMNDGTSQIRDLRILIAGSVPSKFSSGVRMQEYAYYSKREQELETLLEKSTNEYNRNKLLYDKEVISAEEYEQFLYAMRNARNELSSLRDNQLSLWQTDLNTMELSRMELQSSLEQLTKDKEFYYVTSPVSGTVEQFTGIYKGNNLVAGQTIAVISPDSTLFAEIYVSPENIGYIHRGMPVNVQIESFDYNQWGTIPGRVNEISSDFYFDSNTGSSYYKVKCLLERDHLTLKNGTPGYLKKGMTARAHFVLTRKSLFQLLYQKMDDWLNPTQYDKP